MDGPDPETGFSNLHHEDEGRNWEVRIPLSHQRFLFKPVTFSDPPHPSISKPAIPYDPPSSTPPPPTLEPTTPSPYFNLPSPPPHLLCPLQFATPSPNPINHRPPTPAAHGKTPPTSKAHVQRQHTWKASKRRTSKESTPQPVKRVSGWTPSAPLGGATTQVAPPISMEGVGCWGHTNQRPQWQSRGAHRWLAHRGSLRLAHRG